MITCPKCAKENQDHYKFCLGCGAELPRDASPKKFAAGTPPQGVPVVRGASDEVTSLGTGAPPPRAGSAPAPAPGVQTPAAPPRPASPAAPPAPAPVIPTPAASPPPVNTPAPVVATPAPVVAAPTVPEPAVVAAAAAAASPPVICPQCEYPNPASNKFCASCGFKLSRPAVPAAAPAPVAVATAGMLTALRADGSEAGSFSLPAAPTVIGRDTGSIFAGDSYLSPRHASFIPQGGKLYVRDEGSLNGVYRKLHPEEPTPIAFGDIFRIGQELLRLEALAPLPPAADGVERLGSPVAGYVGRIALIIGRDATGNAFPIPEAGLHLGRERGDILFPEDGYVSGLHCRISYQGGQFHVTDLGSSNGSFVRLAGEVEITNGDILLMGQQLFRVTL